MNRRNKKYMFVFAALLLGILILVVFPVLRNQRQIWTLESTDLTDLAVMNIRPGQKAESVDFTRFKKSPDFEDRTIHGLNYRYYEDFLVALDSRGTIVKLQTLSDKGLRSFEDGTVNNMEQVENRWGTRCVVRSFDREQGLDARIYYDKKNRLQAKLVYPKNGDHGGKIVFLILEKY